MIIIISSEPGFGKTFHSMGWEEPILYLDLENPRAEKTRSRHYPKREIEIKPILQRATKHKRDYYLSYLELKKQVDKLLEIEQPEFATLCIDGISDIRIKYAKAKWFHDHPKRQNPLPEEWTEINKTTNTIIEPLIDMANDCDFHLVLTAQFCDEYGKCEKHVDGRLVTSSEKLGREPNVEDWQAYGVDTLIILSQEKGKYIASCSKSIVGTWSADITGKSLFEVLKDRGV